VGRQTAFFKTPTFNKTTGWLFLRGIEVGASFQAKTASAHWLVQHAQTASAQAVLVFAVAGRNPTFATELIRAILGPYKTDGANENSIVLALRCRSMALYLDLELNCDLDGMLHQLFPPRSMYAAAALAETGDLAVPFLSYKQNWKANEKAASVRVLRLIGSARAKACLRGYLHERTKMVVSELAFAVNPLEIDVIRSAMIKGERLPEGIAHEIVDIAPLASLGDMEHLDLTATQVRDLTPVRGLKKLKKIEAGLSQVESLEPVAELKALETLDVRQTKVVSLTPIAGLSELTWLDLSSCPISDISALAGLKKLRWLYLSGTAIDGSPGAPRSAECQQYTGDGCLTIVSAPLAEGNRCKRNAGGVETPGLALHQVCTRHSLAAR
jgi:hypothetical protein